ncbi:VCBS repeat-containing protein [Actinoplanes missouriensis]
MLLLNDQQFVFEIWRRAREGSFVSAEALRAYAAEESDAAYNFIVSGIFAAANDDNQVEIATKQAQALRRSVLVTVGLDASDTALIEKDDYRFIVAVWEKAEEGSSVKAAARAAWAEGSTQTEWTRFLTTGAAEAAKEDLDRKLKEADEVEAARLRAEALAAAKRSLLQLLLLPVTQELIDAPNRQYVLHIKDNAKGTEVKLAAQAALNASDATLAQALHDFIFTGGAAANTADEKAAAAKELADYRTRVTAIRDAARAQGLSPNLVAAADKALTANTTLALQQFLLKGQDVARDLDKKAGLTDVPFAGDFNGDGHTEIGAYRTSLGQWTIKNVRDGKQLLTKHVYGGNGSDVPVVGDFDGDGSDDFGLYRKSNGTWHLKSLKTGQQIIGGFAISGSDGGDLPVVGDFNGDGSDDIGLYTQNCSTGSTFSAYSVKQRANIKLNFKWGGCSDIPVAGDFNGDGSDDLGLYRRDCGVGSTWYGYSVRTNATLFSGLRAGGCTDTPVVGDFNGDNSDDFGFHQQDCTNGSVWRAYNVKGRAYLLNGLKWGGCKDIPVAGDYNGSGADDLGRYTHNCATGSTLASYEVKLGGVSRNGVLIGNNC